MRPLVQYLITCDDVQTDPNNPLRVNVFGLITNIRSTANPPFPVIRPLFCVLVIMTRCKGTGDLSVRIVQNATGDVIFANHPRTVRFAGNPQEAVGVSFRVRNCTFPAAGLYWVEVYYSQSRLARRPIQLLG
jgi:hypothetical protein